MQKIGLSRGVGGGRAFRAHMPRLAPPGSSVRQCGTPGCTLRDFHPGPCITEAPAGKRPRPTNLEEPKKFRKGAKRPEAEKRPRKPKPVTILPKEPPPEQSVVPSGLHRFYHAHRWGVPLPVGPVAEEDDSDDELDESWRLSETEERIRSRGLATPAEVDFMMLWNAEVHRAAPLVSDRALPGACRRFAAAHAERLRTSLRAPLLAHLRALSAHQLLRREDVLDVMVIVDAPATSGGAKSPDQAAKKKKSPKRSPPGTMQPRESSVDTCARCARPQHQPDCAARAACS